MADFPGHSLLW